MICLYQKVLPVNADLAKYCMGQDLIIRFYTKLSKSIKNVCNIKNVRWRLYCSMWVNRNWISNEWFGSRWFIQVDRLFSNMTLIGNSKRDRIWCKVQSWYRPCPVIKRWNGGDRNSIITGYRFVSFSCIIIDEKYVWITHIMFRRYNHCINWDLSSFIDYTRTVLRTIQKAVVISLVKYMLLLSHMRCRIFL